MEMKEQKSIVVDIQMRQGEKWFMLESDKKLRRCTGACLSQALKQGITKGDEVLYTINHQDLFSYLKKTGQHLDLKELPAPASEETQLQRLQQLAKEKGFDPSIVQQQPAQLPVKTDWERKFEASQKENGIIHWQALLNTAVKIVEQSGPYLDDEPRDVAKMVEETAERLHAFIMEKVGEK